jgi:two-component system NtrC family sensor kinase
MTQFHHRARRRVTHAERLRATIRAQTSRIRELEAQVATFQRRPSASPDARLDALLSISAALIIAREVETIFSLVVREAGVLFPGSSGTLLFLADGEPQRLVLRAATGGQPAELTLAPGQGLAGRAFLAPRAMLVVGPEVEMALSELDEQQIDTLQGLLTTWPPCCALLAPLRIERQRIGSVVLYGGMQAHMLHPRDLPFFQALADLAAVAIAEKAQRIRAAELQQNLDQTQTLHEQAQARLNAAQAQLLQSARLAAVGELAASVAHEINNPLYAARNSLYLVEQDLANHAPQRAFLEIARNELSRIARIITRMRDFYRPARDELGPTDLNALLEETLALVQVHLRHGNVEVQTNLQANMPRPDANADQIRQVLLNLILNACDAMPDGGTLQVHTFFTTATNLVTVRISDSGCGIPDQFKPHLFEPFYTTKVNGTGLGLTISAHIVTQHGGQITVESEEGQGATFTITLPLHVPMAAAGK